MRNKKNETEISQDALHAKIKLHIDAAEQNLFRDENKRRYRMERRNKTLAVLSVLLVVVFVICNILPNGLDIFNTRLSLAWYAEMVTMNIGVFANWLGGTVEDANQYAIVQYFIVALVGAALSISGAVYQGAFRNALASPTTLGVQAGGVLGGTIYVMLFMGHKVGDWALHLPPFLMKLLPYFFQYAMSLFILGGCILMVSLVMLTALKIGRGKMSTLTLILSGTVFGGCVAELLSLIQYYMLFTNNEDNRTYALRYMMMGTFNGVFTYVDLMMLGIPIGIGIFAIMMLRTKLNLLVFGEDEAISMGINVKRIRLVTVLIVTALTAVVISYCGMIGFVGFIVPHMARKAVGPDFRYLIPGSGLIGAIVMMIVFHIASAIGLSDNINIMTSIVGGGIFIVMVIWFRRRGNADWA